jgi:cell division protein FtsI/penicillin-binding protein 2
MRAGAIFLAIVGLLIAGGAARLVQIEHQRGPELRDRAARQQTTRHVIPCLRGEILDTRGRVLAGTVRRPSLFVDPALVPDPTFAAHSVAPLLALDAAELEALIRNGQRDGARFIWLARLVPDELAAAFEEVVAGRGLAGLAIQHEPTRVYPQGRTAAHLIGFVGLDRVPGRDGFRAYEDLRGLAGLEAAENDLLTGTPGRRVAVVDVIRRRVRSRLQEFVPTRDGHTLVLTLDSFIQGIVEHHLRDAVTEFAGRWGTAVVLDPHSGEVLALANYPDFDPSQPFPDDHHAFTPAEKAALADTWRNRAVCDSYEPGSIFKPFVAAKALDAGLARLDETFTINGPVHDFGYHTVHDTKTYHQLTLKQVVSKSSNIGMGLLGNRVGMANLHDWVRDYGFGTPTGIRLPGEHPGQLRPLDEWNPRFSPQSVPIGQELAVTPIQMIAAFAALCNDGLLLRPRIVRGVIAANGATLEDHSEPVVVRRVLAADAARRFRLAALVETVNSGTGTRAQLADYQVFGKTGTAQIARPDGGGYASGAFVASFVGGAPAERPRIVVLVSVGHPQKTSHYGGTVAAPAVKRILADTLAYLREPPEVRPAQPAPRTARAGR